MKLQSRSKMTLDQAINLISNNDNPGDNDEPEVLENYISVQIVSYLYAVDAIQVAETVWRRRNLDENRQLIKQEASA
jgi:hypothetical protein